ncbi:MAG TPA: hypothetical protein PLX49_08630, partial [Prolixibacteraceae bacterium]|nr:hypothetical protein [Prolixibacteraceae bacterium]
MIIKLCFSFLKRGAKLKNIRLQSNITQKIHIYQGWGLREIKISAAGEVGYEFAVGKGVEKLV